MATRKRMAKSATARIETPGGVVKVSTFGPNGATGRDIWVPSTVSIHKVARGATGTLVRLVPEGTSRWRFHLRVDTMARSCWCSLPQPQTSEWRREPTLGPTGAVAALQGPK